MGPSYRIVFYVSGHGFGHTSRAVEVISAVLRAEPAARVVVKTSAPQHLFAPVLQGRCELVHLQCDAGIVQIDSLRLDAGASIRQAVAFQKRIAGLAAAEGAYLRDMKADLTIGDIPPLAVAAATAAGIPSMVIGNFTWDWIYESYRDDAAADVAREMRRIYEYADLALRLPMAGGFEGLETITRDIPFIARRSSHSRDDVRAALALPARGQGKPLVLMAFGGHGLAGLDLSALDRLTGYSIATTDASVQDHARENGRMLYIPQRLMHDTRLRFDDLVCGADVVVTKPGYGIISEAIANDTALVYTSRGDFAEYDVLVREMPRYLRAEFIAPDDLLNGNWDRALNDVLRQPAPPEKPALNGAEVAAAAVVELCNEQRKTKNE